MKIRDALKFAYLLLPQIVEIVKAAELALPGKGRGAEKAEMTKLLLEGLYTTVEEAKEEFVAVWPIIKEKVVDRVVAFLNLIGEFKKSKGDPEPER